MGVDKCQCGECRSHTMTDCFRQRCRCCDLEDMISMLPTFEAEAIRS